MSLNLPRMQRTVALVDKLGQPLLTFHRWWQTVAVAVETAFTDLSATQGELAAALDNITAAQNNILSIESTLTGFVLQQVGPVWTAPTGTAQRTGYATYTAPVISATPTQAEVQALADHVQALSRSVKALVDDLQANGALTS